ncbi:FAD-binding oxidoreductase [Rhodobacteraceae bacterium NNCM2]|nr:FAD-binding oxidoreductase [Coraliihabitans acroporae]
MNAQDHRIGSLWEQTAMPAEPGDDLTDDLDCDVAIVGAGFTGLRTALNLAKAGSNVVVLDTVDIGFGASGRNGGQVNPMLPVARPEELRAAVGDLYFDRMAEVSLGSADELFDLVKTHQIQCDARQHGWLRADHCEAARDTAREAAKAWNAHGAGLEFVDGEDVVRLTGSKSYRSAVLAPRGGAVQPLSLVRGLARAARNAGARIFRNAGVTRLTRADGRWTLTTETGRQVRADWVILATNGYSGKLNSRLKRSILPLTPIQIATDPLSEDQIGPILQQGNTISDTRRVIMYARREPGNQMVFGGIGYRLPFGGIGGFDWLVSDARRIFPSLRDATWKYRWGGQIALTRDHVPHLHEPEPGMIAGLGYNGRGVAMSLVMGRVLASRVLGADPSTLPFPVSRIESIPFRDTQVFGAGLALNWMRLRDRIELQ